MVIPLKPYKIREKVQNVLPKVLNCINFGKCQNIFAPEKRRKDLIK